MTKYIAETSEEFVRLEGLAKKLFQEFVILGCGVQVKEGICDEINISPQSLGEINRFYALKENSTGKLLDASSDYLVLELDGQKYRINYKPEDRE